MSNIKVAKNLKELTSQHIEKVVINAGIGGRSKNATNFEEKILPRIVEDISRLSGQAPQVRQAKKSIAGFSVREGDPVGLRVTLRGSKKVDFLERLVRIVLPRMHDFRGIELSAVDDSGAVNIGFRDQYVFPEVDEEKSTYSFSLGINIVPRQKGREEALEIYREIGIPLQAASQQNNE